MKVKVKSLSRVRLFATPWTSSLPGSSLHWILQARVLKWVAIFLPPGGLPDPGIEPGFPAFQADALTSEPPGTPRKLSTKELMLLNCDVGEDS